MKAREVSGHWCPSCNRCSYKWHELLFVEVYNFDHAPMYGGLIETRHLDCTSKELAIKFICCQYIQDPREAKPTTKWACCNCGAGYREESQAEECCSSFYVSVEDIAF